MKYSMRNASSQPESSKSRHVLPRPKWLRTSKAVVQGKGTEMVMLSKDSPLSSIPAEIQISVLHFLPYEDILNLKKTSRYFHYFITPDILQECKQTQIDRWAETELQGGWPDDLPCYDCLKLKPKVEFYINNTYGDNRTTPGFVDTNRHCILCSFKNSEYDAGTRVSLNGQSLILCASCGSLETELISSLAKVCIPCKTSFDKRQEHGYALRYAQLLFVVSLLTIGGVWNSILIRDETKKWQTYRTKRQQNGKFVFRVELCAFIGWVAILAAVFNEGSTLHFSGRFDKIAKAMVSMLFLLCVCFGCSAWWAYKTSLQRRKVVEQFGRYPEFDA